MNMSYTHTHTHTMPCVLHHSEFKIVIIHVQSERALISD